MPRSASTPRRRRAPRKRDADVMEAAIAVMSERGYAATSIQEVADRVGVLKGSLYHYFSSKEELLFRIVESSHEETTEIASEVSRLGLEPLEELMEYLRRSTTWYLENIERAHILFTERRHLTGECLATANGWRRAFETHVQSLVTVAQDNGDIRADLDVRLIARFLIGMVNNVRFWPSRPGSARTFTTDEIAEALVELARQAVGAD
ncbi:TetR/AcrR family transcriptional regulator [Nocardiopsis sp. ATB16-24]|uniref:TetR/AcrR family transcriptional regulator n=1 Tax=Nocardiopsis sp. ATB16-24 TaxID=3019555 RepID=UPI002555CD5B|nr:TetR/AcrR family transcriptional regulator [Nocardiopsis sp. ATB16-24]